MEDVHNQKIFPTTADTDGSQEALRLVLDAMRVGVGSCDAAGVLGYVNSCFTELFGYTRDDIPTLDAWYEKAYPDPEYRGALVSSWHASLDESALKGTA